MPDEPMPVDTVRDELSPRDDYGQTVEPADPPPSPEPENRSTLHRLLFMLGLLLAVLIVPSVAQRLAYSVSYGREQAKVDVALAGLQKLKAGSLAATSRLVAQAVGPSVVHIRTARKSNAPAGHELGFLKHFESVGQGSGVILDLDGHLVTNYHVVAGSESIAVQLVDGRELAAKVVGTDVLTDLAVLKIDATNLTATPWGDSQSLEVGDMVWAVGSPFGLDHSVTFGIVSAKQRRGVTTSRYQDFLQTDAAVNPGNSGGPLVNSAGHVVGINTAIVGRAYQGISFAIPSEIARSVYERIKTTGRVERGWLGVILDELSPALRQRLELDNQVQGIYVARVVSDSPADRAAIQPGDVIIAWNDEPLNDPLLLTRLVAGMKIGSRAKAKLLRDGKVIEVEVVIDQRPAQFG